MRFFYITLMILATTVAFAIFPGYSVKAGPVQVLAIGNVLCSDIAHLEEVLKRKNGQSVRRIIDDINHRTNQVSCFVSQRPTVAFVQPIRWVSDAVGTRFLIIKIQRNIENDEAFYAWAIPHGDKSRPRTRAA